jgi:hypothetical protein
VETKKDVDLEQYHEEQSIIRHLEKMKPSSKPKEESKEPKKN